MDQISEKAREVGRQIAQSSEYQAFKRASQGLSNDREAVTRLNRLQALEESFTQLMQQGQEPPRGRAAGVRAAGGRGAGDARLPGAGRRAEQL